jgi:hypothetical protein
MNFITTQYCPFCRINVNIADIHLFNSCRPPDELHEITKNLSEDTRKTLFKNILKDRGTLLSISILLADEDIKKDLHSKNFSEAVKDLCDL